MKVSPVYLALSWRLSSGYPRNERGVGKIQPQGVLTLSIAGMETEGG